VTPRPEIRPVAGPEEWREALRVRIAVFVEEQGGPLSDEPDRWDAEARHYLLLDGERVVGAARLYHPEPAVAKIGRVALLPEARGRGWGAELMRELLRAAVDLGCATAVLDAQVSVVGFYRKLGFAAEGEPFVEAGIPHIRMRCSLGAPQGGEPPPRRQRGAEARQ
jgi:predicted GNAT family N-acyltransferase